jgi:hypothetical protein
MLYLERPIRRWRGCRMINILCPGDLCVLPEGHWGDDLGVHLLGTSVEPYQFNPACMIMRRDLDTEEGLVHAGWQGQMEAFPEERRRQHMEEEGEPPRRRQSRTRTVEQTCACGWKGVRWNMHLAWIDPDYRDGHWITDEVKVEEESLELPPRP